MVKIVINIKRYHPTLKYQLKQKMSILNLFLKMRKLYLYLENFGMNPLAEGQ